MKPLSCSLFRIDGSASVLVPTRSSARLFQETSGPSEPEAGCLARPQTHAHSARAHIADLHRAYLT